MNETIKNQDENKKRAAFKRFSQMGVAGLAVISMSAFADLSAKQLPNNAHNGQSSPFVNKSVEKTLFTSDHLLNYSDSPNPDPPYSEYSDAGHVDTHSDSAYANNYSNQCD